MTKKHSLSSLVAAGILTLGASAYGATLINAAGATFPAAIYGKWFQEFTKVDPNSQINYQSLGSGAGIRQLIAGTVDFGASDKPMDDAAIAKITAFHTLHFPTVMGGVVPSYNLEGVAKDLNFTGPILAQIFLGKITKWNDPALAKLNAGVKLPDSDITVVHRSDGSGTTFVFTDYLSNVSPDWKAKTGKGDTVKWQVGLGAKGNEGVAGQLKNAPNSIGYLELFFAVQNKMSYGAVQNKSGKFLRANLDSVTAAAAAASKAMPDDFRVSIVDQPGTNAYPISSFTWLLIPDKFTDPAKKKAIVGFLKWMLSPTGQAFAAPLSYAPLPQEVIAKELKQISKIQ